LPEILPSGISIGMIKANVSDLTGLHQGTVVVTGGYDHAVGAIGAGNFHQGIISMTTGTSMAMVVTLNNPVMDPLLNLPCQCHVIGDSYFLQPYGQTAGMVFRWFRDEFCREEKLMAEKTGKDPYDLMTSLAAPVPAGCGGLIMLPHLAGAGSPEYNIKARGVFEGISLGMGKPYFIRAIMESVAFMIRKNLDVISAGGIHFNEIRALGGAARSSLWNQMIADVTGMPLKTLRVAEAPASGAAILAGTGAAIFKNIEEGINNIVNIKDDFIPTNAHLNEYQKAYDKYLHLYLSLISYMNE
jgi:xylulokinase